MPRHDSIQIEESIVKFRFSAVPGKGKEPPANCTNIREFGTSKFASIGAIRGQILYFAVP
jgi:hypothetical protein